MELRFSVNLVDMGACHLPCSLSLLEHYIFTVESESRSVSLLAAWQWAEM